MPIPPPNAANMQHLPNYPSAKELGERRLKIVLFPLDITHQHMMRRGNFNGVLKEYLDKGSPLAEWMKVFIDAIFNTMESLNVGHVGDNTG